MVACFTFNYLFLCLQVFVFSVGFKNNMPRKYVLFNVAVSVFTCIRVVEIEFCFDQYVIILQFRAIAFSCYFYLHYSLRRILYLSYPFMCDYLSAKYYYNMHFHISLTKTLLPLIYYCYYAFK